MPLREREVLTGKNVVYSFIDSFRPESEQRRSTPDQGECIINEATNSCESDSDRPFFDSLQQTYEAIKQTSDSTGNGNATGIYGTTASQPPSPSSRTEQNTQGTKGETYKFRAVGEIGKTGTLGQSLDNCFVMSLDNLEKLRKTMEPNSPAPQEYSSVLVKEDDVSHVEHVHNDMHTQGFSTGSIDDIRKENPGGSSWPWAESALQHSSRLP
jgi:hypothetical protein